MSAIQQVLASYGSVSVTYATWNPSDKWANIILSNGNLTVADTTAGNAHSVRSTISKWASSWKWYWEMYIVEGSFSVQGIANSSAGLTNYIGATVNWWTYYNTGQKINNWSITAYWSSYTTGDTIWVALDYSGASASITFYKNNVSQWVAFSGITWSIFAASSEYPLSSQTTNFWASAFTYSPPAGFNAWLYN